MRLGEALRAPFSRRTGTTFRAANLFAPAFVLAISIVVAAQLYNYAIARWTPTAAYQLQQSLVDHTAAAPNRYRVLVPSLVQALAEALPIPGQPLLRFLAAYFVYYQLSLAFSLLMLLAYLRQWYSQTQALVGLLVAAISLLVAFGDGYFQPWSLLEIGLFAAGLLAIYRRQHVWLLVWVVLATLNRETGVFLAVAYLLIHLKRKSPVLTWTKLAWTALYLAVWAGTYLAVHLWLGPAPQDSLAQIWRANLQPGALALAGVNLILFLGVFWVFVWQGYRTAPVFVRASWRIVPIYLIAVVVFGLWAEVRLLTPLYAILLSTGLSVWPAAG